MLKPRFTRWNYSRE